MKLEFKKVIKDDTLNKIKKVIQSFNTRACFEGRYYFALKGGRIAGCICLVDRGWYMTEMKHLFVKDGDRGHGIGKFLLEEALKKMKTPFACCTIKSDNERSIRLFSGRSFKEINCFRNSVTGHDLLLMVRKLEG